MEDKKNFDFLTGVRQEFLRYVERSHASIKGAPGFEDETLYRTWQLRLLLCIGEQLSVMNGHLSELEKSSAIGAGHLWLIDGRLGEAARQLANLESHAKTSLSERAALRGYIKLTFDGMLKFLKSKASE